LNNLFPHLALLGASIIYGINYTVAKGVMPDYLQPMGFIFTRVSGALLLFFALSLFFTKEKIIPKDFIRLALCGLFGVALNQSLFFIGLNITTPINASIIMTSNPILVLITSSILLGEKLNLRKWGGIFLGLTGALLVIAFGKNIHFGSDTFWGDLLVFLNASSYGIYLVIVKPLMAKYKPITVINWVFFFGFLYVTPFGFSQFAGANWSEFPTKIIGAVAFVVIGTTFLTYLFNIYALKRVSPNVVSIYIYTQPIIASFIAVLFGMDELTTLKVFATFLIFTGVYLISIRPRKKNNLQKT
jgi:drug/metabolite transporter (DMT)-like permease